MISVTTTRQTDAALVLVQEIPLDRHPAIVYLAHPHAMI